MQEPDYFWIFFCIGMCSLLPFLYKTCILGEEPIELEDLFNDPEGFWRDITVEGAPIREWQLGFQRPASPVMEGIISFHDDLLVFIVFILFFVLYMLVSCVYRFGLSNRDGVSIRLIHASTLEIIWTVIPALILILVAIPSFALLYSVDEIIEPLFTVKAIGHQWYWSYEFLDQQVFGLLLNRGEVQEIGPGSFDSYMLNDEDLSAMRGLDVHRLLTVDNHLYLPVKANIRVIVTSSDVLHSWAVPSLGVKLDACPGRLNQTSVFIKRPGFYYGQCSELCGVNHGFMPIGIVGAKLLPMHNFLKSLDFEALVAALQSIAVR